MTIYAVAFVVNGVPRILCISGLIRIPDGRDP